VKSSRSSLHGIGYQLTQARSGDPTQNDELAPSIYHREHQTDDEDLKQSSILVYGLLTRPEIHDCTNIVQPGQFRHLLSPIPQDDRHSPARHARDLAGGRSKRSCCERWLTITSKKTPRTAGLIRYVTSIRATL